jgi:hypothetical protein
MNDNHQLWRSGRTLLTVLTRDLCTPTGEQNDTTQLLQPVAQELHLLCALKLYLLLHDAIKYSVSFENYSQEFQTNRFKSLLHNTVATTLYH